MPSSPPHPALDAAQNLVPALKSFWPTYRSFFPTVGSLFDYKNHLRFYSNADSFHSAITICAFFSTYVYVMQEITGNASQVDGLWTFLPVVYGAHFTFQKYFAYHIDPPKLGFLAFGKKSEFFFDLVEPRLALMTFLQILWSARLTFNAIRRGMFKPGEEDYRWPLLRQKMPKVTWEIFTFSFIAIGQNILLACTALPQYLILDSTRYKATPPPRPASSLTTGDYIIAGLLVTNLVIQFIADQQQWEYQNFKRGKDANGQPLPARSVNGSGAGAGNVKNKYTAADSRRGFITQGLWAWSRHPNFACEQTTWWILWLYVPLTFYPDQPSSSTFQYLWNAALFSPLLMNILFLASTTFSENVSAEKYPEYLSYQKRVGMFLPFPDTIARIVYYRFMAKEEDRKKVEDDVWGSPAVPTKKGQ